MTLHQEILDFIWWYIGWYIGGAIEVESSSSEIRGRCEFMCCDLKV